MRIDDIFQKLQTKGEGALIAFITGGDPAPKYTPKIVEALVQGGADIIEIGVPFSDPIADGPLIQASDNRALQTGTTPDSIFSIVKKTKRQVEVPIVLLTYYNILFKRGVQKFLHKAAENGVEGLIIPDLPIEEAQEYHTLAVKEGIKTIFLATPSTSEKRLKNILQYTSGFLYLVSVFGITGIRNQLTQLTIETIKRLKPIIQDTIPLAVGFGISQPQHVHAVIDAGAEAAIVGSAFVKIIEDNLNTPSEITTKITTFTRKMKKATVKHTRITELE